MVRSLVIAMIVWSLDHEAVELTLFLSICLPALSGATPRLPSPRRASTRMSRPP